MPWKTQWLMHDYLGTCTKPSRVLHQELSTLHSDFGACVSCTQATLGGCGLHVRIGVQSVENTP